MALAAFAGCSVPKNNDFHNVVFEGDSLTFYYKNSNAKEVLLDVQFAGRNKMTKDSQTGIWKVTLKQPAPDLYPYCFVVDGVGVADPECKEYFPNEGFKNSLLDVPNRDGMYHDIKNVPHGNVEYVNYYSESLGAVNHAVVCLPPSYYSNSEKKYPVFYLISGTTDTEETYYKTGRVNYIADNLVHDNLAEEMIIVLPYGNPYKLLAQMPDIASIPQTNFGEDVFSLDLNNDLMPYIENHYRTINDKDHRAIGGFSRGGNQALANGLLHLDKFSYLCSYSSFTSMDLPDVYDNADKTNSQIKLFWLGVGTDDFLYGNAREYTEFLDNKKIRCVKHYTTDKYGHTWMNARYFLNKTLPLLFRPEKAENEMSNATPTLAATGNEAYFTPGVMARLFPKPLLSPEYKQDGIIFRFKSDAANKVSLVTESKEYQMQKDTAGIWSVVVADNFNVPFTYYYNVDGTAVCDALNMYILPSEKFRESVANHNNNRYNYLSSGKIEYGKISYNVAQNTADYYSVGANENSRVVVLENLENGSIEDWFKAGFANIVVDRLVAEKKIQPCRLTTSNTIKNAPIIRARDFKTWAERQKALEQCLIEGK